MKTLLSITALACSLIAQEITLPQTAHQAWDFNPQKLPTSSYVPLGTALIEVTIPPQQLHSVSIPFEAQISKLYISAYDRVKPGQLLASVTAKPWIDLQREAISSIIEYRHHKELHQRNMKLCKEEIIPQKRCVQSEAELQNDKIRLSGYKAMLEAYGADQQSIKELFDNLHLNVLYPVKATTTGSVIEALARPGKNTRSGESLFIIKESGSHWIESDINLNKASKLKEGDTVRILFDKRSIEVTVLRLSDIVDPGSQRRHVRFATDASMKLIPGIRRSAKIALQQQVFQVPKDALANIDDKAVLFVRKGKNYLPVAVSVISEDEQTVYVSYDKKLEAPVATQSVAILKSMALGDDDE